jgi:hypothetical protein
MANNPDNCLKGQKIPMKYSVRIGGVPAEIRREHLQNTNPGHYRYSNPVGMLFILKEVYLFHAHKKYTK